MDKKKILVIIDMQNDFIDGSLGTPEARGIVDKVCKKIRGEEWDLIFTTQDSHNTNYLATQEGRKLPVEHCISGTYGFDINEDVYNALNELDHEDRISHMYKDRFAYPWLHDEIFSGYLNRYKFYHGWEADIDLTLVGVCTDICVISNALLLKAHYPEMNIMVDAACCAGTTPEKHRMALEVMKNCQIDIENYFYEG